MARILVVDDEPEVREVLRLVLERDGHDVEEAETGRDALARLDVRPADLVLSDVMMPDMNGLDLLREVTLRERGGVPFVLLTSYADARAREAALFAGAHDYLLKPFDPAAVRTVVRGALAAR
jgi:CheY-like chemotaxis protein